MKNLVIVLAMIFIAAQNSYAQTATARQALLDAGNYSGGATYRVDDVVLSSGVYYKSLVGANMGHTPASSPTQWSVLGSSSSVVAASSSTAGIAKLELGLASGPNTTAVNAANEGVASGIATLDSGGHVPSGQMPTSIAAIEVKYFAAAICSGGVAYSAGLSTYDNQQPALGCIASSTSSAAYMAFQAAASPLQYTTATVATPPYWTGTDLVFSFEGTATSGNVIWIVDTGCTNANGDVSAPTFGTPVSVTTTVSTTLNGLVNTASTANVAVPATNGCTQSTIGPSSLVTIRIHRSASDTQTGDARLLGITLTTHRSQ